MESDARSQPYLSFYNKATEAFQRVEFDNIQQSVDAAQAEIEMTLLISEAKFAKKQLEAADLMLEGLKKQRTVLADECNVADKKSHDARCTYELKTIAMDNRKQYLRGLLSDRVTASKPWERPQRDAGASKTRPVDQYWIMLTIAYAVDPTPLTKSELASALNISPTGKAFSYALKDMCHNQILQQVGGPRGKYQLHSNLQKAMECAYVATPSNVTVSDALRSFSVGNKNRDEVNDKS